MKNKVSWVVNYLLEIDLFLSEIKVYEWRTQIGLSSTTQKL